MNKSLLSLCCLALILCSAEVEAQNFVEALEPIGAVSSFTKSDTSITFNCQDGSQVRVFILAPDLIRVRASFRQALPVRDHSWAIAKESWDAVRWSVKETAESIVISTDELDVVVRRSPLLIEFRDAKTGAVINADERPMMFDAKGAMNSIMFDPKAGTFVAAAKKLGFDEHFYGLGEKAAHLDKRRGYFINWNSDTPAYTEGKDPIYQTIPFYIGLEHGTAYGIFFDNSYRSYFDFGRTTQRYAAFGAEGGEMNYYFFYGPAIKKILGRYTELTGRMPLPPLWALGNQQSRWSYYPDTMVEEVVREYRQRDLPLDVVHLDIDYMQGYRVFTWDTRRFPNPKALTDKLKQQGVKLVTIVDPGVKYQPSLTKDTGEYNFENYEVFSNTPPAIASPATPELLLQNRSYYVFNQGMEKNFFQKRRSGQLFIPRVWPGESVFVDFTLPEARRWWGDLHRAYTDNGVAGIWNDMNEPSDFVDQTGRNQIDVVSYDEGENSTHAKNRNVFALLEARATFEGLLRLQPDKRPYIITRAGYAGIQRYSTMWTGDTTSTWDTLALSIPVFQTLGLSGETFVGSDVGGFMGRGNGELLTRAYQVSFLAPFCRNHKVIDGYDQEPWRFGKYYEDIIRHYLKLRYRLLPFLYNVLEEAHRTGVPLFRPLLLNYQNDSNMLNLDDEFMVGDDLLVAPVLEPNQTSRLVYLPEGVWYDLHSGKKYTGGTMIRVDAPLEVAPLFIRGGAIIPEGPEMNYVGEKHFDPLSFYIHPDAQGRAALTLYEDDGTSNAYQSGVSRRTRLSVAPARTGFEITVSPAEGSYQPGARKFFFVAPFERVAGVVTLDGKPLRQTDADGKSVGYHVGKGSVRIAIEDDGKAHRIIVR